MTRNSSSSSSSNSNTNPFDDGHDVDVDVDVDATNNINSQNPNTDNSNHDGTPIGIGSVAGVKVNNIAPSASSSSSSSSLFPAWLSTWMALSPPSTNGDSSIGISISISSRHNAQKDWNEEDQNDDDDGTLYHDCLSTPSNDLLSPLPYPSSAIEDETTSLLPNSHHRDHIKYIASDSLLSPLRRKTNMNIRLYNYNATATTSTSTSAIRTTPLSTPLRKKHQFNNHDAVDLEQQQYQSYNTNNPTISTNSNSNSNSNNSLPEAMASPLAHALATWLSPYADSARRAGRNMFYFSETTKEEQENDDTTNGNNDGGGMDRDTEEWASLLHGIEYDATTTTPQLRLPTLSPPPSTRRNGGVDRTARGAVRFQLLENETNPNGTDNNGYHHRSTSESKRSLLSRVSSSPALMTMVSSEDSPTKEGGRPSFTAAAGYNDNSIVLTGIDVQQGGGEHNNNNNDSDNDNNLHSGTVTIHPWTKLILLEELGTAWSWFVLLLPYVFLALAVLLDGDTTSLKNTTVGPLRGDTLCADIASSVGGGIIGGGVPAPYEVSVKGYYPVPFWLNTTTTTIAATANTTIRSTTEVISCTYPYELREGVGLLSHDNSHGSNLTEELSKNPFMTASSVGKVSIIDARYRYLMSHGHAFTSGIISSVPATSQSLRGSVKFNNLSSNSVALVARGSVLISAIVFQREPEEDDNDYDDMSSVINANNTNVTHEENPYVKQWSPVLILGSKRLDMICIMNDNNKNNNHHSDKRQEEPTTWNCSSRRIVDAFFSLPNAAVLTGGDLRVDILLSHHKTQTSLTEDLWLIERGGGGSGGVGGGGDDDYITFDYHRNSLELTKAEKILSLADVSHAQDLLAELSNKSVYELKHESVAFNHIVETVRIFALALTLSFFFYWWYCMGIMYEDLHEEDTASPLSETWSSSERIQMLARKWSHILSRMCRMSNPQRYFWFEDPWTTFPERRYLFWLLCCLIMLQNPLLVYAFFHPWLYSSPKFRFAADSISGMSVHGILFFWLCLVHGLRYHTAGIHQRRLDQHRRVLELRKATKHIAPSEEVDNSQWGGVRWYYQQYGDLDGGYSLALRMKHDITSDSFIEFILPKVTLLMIGIVASITVAASRFPMSEKSIAERTELNPDRFGSGSKVYAVSSFVQLIVINIWCLFIIYTSFVTGERLRREPFLSTRPAQLAFRVLSSILLLGAGFSVVTFYLHALNLFGSNDTSSGNDLSGSDLIYDTSLGGGHESWDSRADILFGIIRRVSTEIPYVGTASNIQPGKILYATACSLVVAHIFLPSTHFNPSTGEQHVVEEIATTDSVLKQSLLADMDKRIQGRDKRFVVALARNTHTWRVFPLPIRSHGLLSQHTVKEQLNIVGTFQLDAHFNMHMFKFGRGAIYKGKYIPVFCVELACWLLEASWQAYYSPTEYSLNEWAPGRMSLDKIGLKLEHAVHDADTDTHAFVASNVSEQVEGEKDSIIVVSFRGSASFANIKTDLSFRQVPLPEKIISDTPAFNIRPGKPTAVDEAVWDESSSPSIIQELLSRRSAGKYSSWPKETPSSAPAEHLDPELSLIIPTVSKGAKAIIRAAPIARQALPCVHEGFLKNYLRVRQEIIAAILSIFKRQLDKSVDRSRHGEHDEQPLTLPKLYLTGHSMGGAFAQLLALDLASNCEIVIDQPIQQTSDQCYDNGTGSKQSLTSLGNRSDESGELSDLGDAYWLGQELAHHHHRMPTKKIRLRPPIAVYTYGQSRLGNLAFKTIYKKRVPHTFRVATEGDAITTMPTLGPWCGGIYRHAGLEVLLEEGCTGNVLVGPTVVETLLRFTKVRTSMAAHSMDRYRESLESALGREDLKEYYRGHGGKVRHNQGAYSGSGAPLPSWVTSVKRSRDV